MQGGPGETGGNRGPGAPGGAGMAPGGFPLPLLMRTLDANGDGIIDAGEITNATAALRKLDKNGDGKLTPDEYRDPGMPVRTPANGPRGGPAGAPGDSSPDGPPPPR